MKKNVTFLFALLSLLGCGGSVGNEPMQYEGLRAAYTLGEDIAFNVKNTSDETIFYGISVQSKIDGKWREIVADITAPYKTSFIFSEIASRETKNHSWPLKYMPLKKGGVKTENRFVIFYLSTRDYAGIESAPKIYSSEFEINTNGK